MHRTVILILALILARFLTEGAIAADARNGETLAKRWCATCHVVASDQKRATGEAPPFSSIGRTPNLDASRLALFLLLPHPNMPAMTLSRSEASDLAAYIASQGK
jgi:mono/diheme cytochrome c family protein